jgi:hypothetical protein
VTLPLADAAALRGAARRTAAVRLFLASALVACLGAAVALSDGGGAATARAAGGGSGSSVEVVVDVSGSVADLSNPQILRSLRQIASTAKRAGLVVFSDDAEEVLPPGTPVRELRRVFRYFEPERPHQYAPTPWSLRFTGGTAISTGIAAARRALERERVRGAIVLVSDAADNVADTRSLRRELLAVARDGLRFRLVRLKGSTAGDVAVYRRIFGTSAIRPASAVGATPAKRTPGAPFPIWLVAVAGIAAVLAALRELVAVSLRWRAA